jgi:hypothetical protein
MRQSLLGGTGIMNSTLVGSKGRAGRGHSWNMVKNEDPSGLNPYSGGHPNIAADLVVRKRNVDRERKISPR